MAKDTSKKEDAEAADAAGGETTAKGVEANAPSESRPIDPRDQARGIRDGKVVDGHGNEVRDDNRLKGQRSEEFRRDRGAEAVKVDK